MKVNFFNCFTLRVPETLKFVWDSLEIMFKFRSLTWNSRVIASYKQLLCNVLLISDMTTVLSRLLLTIFMSRNTTYSHVKILGSAAIHIVFFSPVALYFCLQVQKPEQAHIVGILDVCVSVRGPLDGQILQNSSICEITRTLVLILGPFLSSENFQLPFQASLSHMYPVPGRNVELRCDLDVFVKSFLNEFVCINFITWWFYGRSTFHETALSCKNNLACKWFLSIILWIILSIGSLKWSNPIVACPRWKLFEVSNIVRV